ncbi:MAG: glycosyltransferase [Bacteroidia bacterium]|nr:glycosyltransferase [Bacteroidia bacterium]
MDTPNTPLSLLILTDWFAPGFKAGGPIRSCVNLACALQHQAKVRVLCGDRDAGDAAAYEGIPAGEWIAFDQAVEVAYLSPAQQHFAPLRDWIRRSGAEVLYLNSMFSVPFTIIPLLLKRMGLIRQRLILAPRGMLHAGAMQFKPRKKQVFLRLLQLIGADRDVHFQATDAQEVQDIRAIFGADRPVTLLPNLPPSMQAPFQSTDKAPGNLRLLFLSRIHPKKHLEFLLRVLQQVHGDVELEICGPVDDVKYWAECQELIAHLPGNIRVLYLGEIPNPEVTPRLQANHVFVLPTHGENYGHAILESFLAGRPVIISDRSPWRNLAASGIGYDLPLEAPEAFRDAIEALLRLDRAGFDAMAQAAWLYGRDQLEDSGLKAAYLAMFANA